MPSKSPAESDRNPESPSTGTPLLSAPARDRRRRWQERLEAAGLLPEGLDVPGLAAAVAASGRSMTARIGLAMLQEGILCPQPDGEGGRIELPGAQGEIDVLLLRGLEADDPGLFPDLSFQRRDGQGRCFPVEDPIELLELIAPLLEGTAPRDLARLAEEVTDAQLNDALCGAFRALWNGELRQRIAAAGCATFWSWLLRREGPQEPSVLLEQWSAVGHPYHPTHKTRRDMSPGEALAYCPEFRPRVRLRLAAVRSARLRGESLPEGPPIDRWLDHYFPTQAEAWRTALTDQGLDPALYAALPVHPWQAEHAIPSRFSRSIAQGDLLLLPEPRIPADPLVSVRTLAAATAADAPHLKLSLGVRLTSVERTISPRSCEMGPRISRLLETLIERDEVLAATLRILPEEVGLYFSSAFAEEAEESRHLAALLRGNPARLSGGEGAVVPGTALAADSPVSGAPLFLELGQGAATTEPAAARALFARYAEAFLRPLLTLYLRYGIALEAHLQNSLVHCDASGNLLRCVFRDFGGIRIHEPSLRSAGLELKLHPDRLTVVDDRRAVRGKFTAHGLHRHLGYLISRICRHLQTGEAPFWSDVAELAQTIMDELRGDLPAETWRQERAALLDEDWEFKANLRMRMADSSKDVYVRIANPLRRRS